MTDELRLLDEDLLTLPLDLPDELDLEPRLIDLPDLLDELLTELFDRLDDRDFPDDLVLLRRTADLLLDFFALSEVVDRIDDRPLEDERLTLPVDFLLVPFRLVELDLMLDELLPLLVLVLSTLLRPDVDRVVDVLLLTTSRLLVELPLS